MRKPLAEREVMEEAGEAVVVVDQGSSQAHGEVLPHLTPRASLRPRDHLELGSGPVSRPGRLVPPPTTVSQVQIATRRDLRMNLSANARGLESPREHGMRRRDGTMNLDLVAVRRVSGERVQGRKGSFLMQRKHGTNACNDNDIG